METKYRRKTKIYAGSGLILTTMIWGSAFVVMKNSVDVIPPTYLLALRFTIAAAALCLLFHKRLPTMTGREWKSGVILGLFLGLSYLFQTYGLKYTTASKNAFITTLYVIIVPFLHWFINKKRPGASNMAAAVLAVAGLALLSLEGDMGINFGDFLTLICGVTFAMHMVLIDRYTADQDPVILTIIQILTAALMNWLLAPVLDGGFPFSVMKDGSLLLGIGYLALFSTMLGFLLQNVGQKFLSANTSAILLSMESVFGALFSVFFLKEVLTERMLMGCALMFAAVILSEVGPESFRKEKNGETSIYC